MKSSEVKRFAALYERHLKLPNLQVPVELQITFEELDAILADQDGP